MKKPKFLTKLAAVLPSRPKTRYKAAVRAARPQQIEDYNDDQPTTKLSSAFVVVLILHIVAVGGIYAFNSIKASRRNHAQILAATSPAVNAAAKTAEDTDSAPVAAPVPVVSPAAIHPAVSHSADPAVSPARGAPVPKSSGLRQHQVKAGENPTKIASAYHVTIAELLAVNGLKDNAVLHIGQTLSIPASKSEARTPAETHKTETKLTDIPPTRTTPGLHVVKKNETVHSIARIYGMTSGELIKLNKIADPKKLPFGQTLRIPPRKS